jgi:hypothetical protein
LATDHLVIWGLNAGALILRSRMPIISLDAFVASSRRHPSDVLHSTITIRLSMHYGQNICMPGANDERSIWHDAPFDSILTRLFKMLTSQLLYFDEHTYMQRDATRRQIGMEEQ